MLVFVAPPYSRLSSRTVRLWFGEGIELFLPGGRLFGPAPGLVEPDDMANRHPPFIGGHLGVGGKKPLGTRQHERLSFGVSFARQLNCAEPILSLGGKFWPELARGILAQECRRLLEERLCLVQLVLFHQHATEVEQGAPEG